MKEAISFRALANALFIVLFISYVLCIVGDLLTGWAMHQAWAPLLPGFAWPPDLGGFLIGLLWLVFYSLYLAALIAFPYNYIVGRQKTA